MPQFHWLTRAILPPPLPPSQNYWIPPRSNYHLFIEIQIDNLHALTAQPLHTVHSIVLINSDAQKVEPPLTQVALNHWLGSAYKFLGAIFFAHTPRIFLCVAVDWSRLWARTGCYYKNSILVITSATKPVRFFLKAGAVHYRYKKRCFQPTKQINTVHFLGLW